MKGKEERRTGGRKGGKEEGRKGKEWVGKEENEKGLQKKDGEKEGIDVRLFS